MNKRRMDGTKERLWRDRISRHEQGGLSIRAFCAAESLSEPSFYWWRRELAGRKAPWRVQPSAQRASTVLPVAQFVPLTVTPSSPCSSIEIALTSGVVIRVPQGWSSQLLREVLAALEANRC